MDASDLTTFKRNRALYAYSLNIEGTNQHIQPGIQTAETITNTNIGGYPFVVDGKVVEPAPSRPIGEYSLDDLIRWLLLENLTLNAVTNMGPTKGSRLNYIFMATIAQAYNWVSPCLSGTTDNWVWSQHALSAPLNSKDTYVFVLHALVAVLPVLVPSFGVAALIEMERVQMGWTFDQQNAYVFNLQQSVQFATWLANWNTWFANRNNDNNISAAAQPPSLPNGSTIIDPRVSQNYNDSIAYPNVNQWTPLTILSKTQKYITYNWLTVRSTALTSSQDTSLMATGDSAFPTNRVSDINTLVSTVTRLQDIQKVQAELWAGGPYTSSPPGIYMYIWSHFTKSAQVAQNMGTTAFILSGLELATNLFEVGRIIWGLKKEHMESRPIQDIRNFFATSTIKAYDGTLTNGSLWLPYQTANYVTPPFADFPSGHSAFGRAFANVMTVWFGATIPATPAVQYPRMGVILSPIFQTDQVMSPGNFLFGAGISEVQPGIVPATDIPLSWTSWADMATSSGLSRQFGGIHCMSAHLGSIAVADALIPLVNASWNFR